MPKRRIFLSATSRDLGCSRELARKTLRERGGYEVDHQEIFHLTFLEIGAKLKQRIAGRDAIVCLIGFASGGQPSHCPPDQPRRSYIQWESSGTLQRGSGASVDFSRRFPVPSLVLSANWAEDSGAGVHHFGAGSISLGSRPGDAPNQHLE